MPCKEAQDAVDELVESLSSYAPNGEISDPDDLEQVRKAAGDLLTKGWRRGEVVQYLRWMEHVDPTMDEDTALRNMARIRQAVEKRLSEM